MLLSESPVMSIELPLYVRPFLTTKLSLDSNLGRKLYWLDPPTLGRRWCSSANTCSAAVVGEGC